MPQDELGPAVEQRWHESHWGNPRWQADRARRLERECRQTERDDIARALHDRISNDLAYAIMRIDRDIECADASGLICCEVGTNCLGPGGNAELGFRVLHDHENRGGFNPELGGIFLGTEVRRIQSQYILFSF